jgi:hypothetical protein
LQPTNAKVSIYNGVGQLVRTEKMDSKGISIDCSNLTVGIYSVVIENAGGIFTDKLVIE